MAGRREKKRAAGRDSVDRPLDDTGPERRLVEVTDIVDHDVAAVLEAEISDVLRERGRAVESGGVVQFGAWREIVHDFQHRRAFAGGWYAALAGQHRDG